MNRQRIKKAGLRKTSSRSGMRSFSLFMLVVVGTAIVLGLAIWFTPLSDDPAFSPNRNQAEANIEVFPPTMQDDSVVFPAEEKELDVERLQSELLSLASQLTTDFPNQTDALHLSAMIFAEFKQFKRAEENWRTCLESGTKEIGPHLGLASVLSERGNDEEAIELLSRLRKSGRHSADLFRDLSACYFRLGDIEKTQEVVAEGLVHYEHDPALWYQQGLVDSQQGKLDDASNALEKAIRLGDTTTATRNALASVLSRQKRADEAKKILEAGAQETALHSNESPNFQSNYSLSLRSLGTKFLHMAAAVAVQHSKPKLAELWLLRLMALDPKDLSAYMELSAVYRKSERWSAALQVQQRLLDLQPDNVLNHINLASVAFQLGKIELAEQVLLKAIVVSPSAAFPRAELSRVYFAKKQFRQAREFAIEARKLEPNNVEWHLMVALAAQALGDDTEMSASLQQAMAVSPNDPRIQALSKQFSVPRP